MHTSSPPADLQVERDHDGIVTITLNRPAARNALNSAMVEFLLTYLADLSVDVTVRGLFIRGAGKHFCAGIDLAWMTGAADEGYQAVRESSVQIQALYRAIYEFPRPTAAVVQGAAVAGGLGLASACDVVIATQDARFGATEVKLGLIPGMLLPLLVRRLGTGPARRIGATALLYDAQEMQMMGLVSRIQPDLAALEADVAQLRDAFLETCPQAVDACKQLVDQTDWNNTGAAFEASLRAVIDSRMSPYAAQGLAAVASRTPAPWARAR